MLKYVKKTLMPKYNVIIVKYGNIYAVCDSALRNFLVITFVRNVDQIFMLYLRILKG